MEPSFWLERWESNNIGFHKKEANPLLVEYVETLALPPGSRICLPLCGKTRDIAWLLSQGYPVIGIELIERPRATKAILSNLTYPRAAIPSSASN